MDTGFISTVFQEIEQRKQLPAKVNEHYAELRRQGHGIGNKTQVFLFDFEEIQARMDVSLGISALITDIEKHIIENPIVSPAVVDAKFIMLQKAKSDALYRCNVLRATCIEQINALQTSQNTLIYRFEQGNELE